VYGVKKTTLYLPDDLKRALERASSSAGRSEAEFIREAVRAAVEEVTPPKPRLPITERGLRDPRVAEEVDRYLEGFGSR